VLAQDSSVTSKSKVIGASGNVIFMVEPPPSGLSVGLFNQPLLPLGGGRGLVSRSGLGVHRHAAGFPPFSGLPSVKLRLKYQRGCGRINGA
jgi:hypothetical protein